MENEDPVADYLVKMSAENVQLRAYVMGLEHAANRLLDEMNKPWYKGGKKRLAQELRDYMTTQRPVLRR